MPDAIKLPIEGPGAPPRNNGELAFSAPWQSRIFGVTAALVEGGTISWSEMQRSLISAIARSAPDGDVNQHYWGCWLEALRQVLDEANTIDPASLEAEQHRLAELYAH